MVVRHMPDLLAHVSRPAVLEIGGRRVTASPWEPPSDWRRTGVDVRPGPGVDVVADVHELSRHVAPGSQDGFWSHAVFEHLAMPWKVALELNSVLRPGGVGWIVTHEAFPVHEWPWDFWRFGSGVWHQLFEPRTGFEVLGARPLEPGRVVPDHAPHEAYAGHLGCEVQVRKIGPPDPRLRWALSSADILPPGHHYPTGATRWRQRLERAWHRWRPGASRAAGPDPWRLLGDGAGWLVIGDGQHPTPPRARVLNAGPGDDWTALLADEADASLDAVALLGSLGLVTRPWCAAAACRRVLRRGGRLYVDDHQVAPAERPGWRLSSEGLLVLFPAAAGFGARRRAHAEPATVAARAPERRGRARAWQRTLGLFEATGDADVARLSWPTDDVVPIATCDGSPPDADRRPAQKGLASADPVT